MSQQHVLDMNDPLLDATDVQVRAIVGGATDRFAEAQSRVHRDTDRLFAALMVGQWVFGILVALVFSPYGWEGKTRSTHAHVFAAVLLGGAISSLPLLLCLKRPGWMVTRHVVAMAQMLWSALLIHLTGGRIETHFHVFGSLAILAFYRDWRVLLTASIIVAADHFVRGIVWPESVYGVVNPEWWRFLEHAFWVGFIDVFLVIACLRNVREMRHMAEQGAMIETRNLLSHLAMKPARTTAPQAVQEDGSHEVSAVGTPGVVEFDEVRVEGAIGWRSLRRIDYEAMPLADRIRLILENKVQFYKNGRMISARDALGGTRV